MSGPHRFLLDQNFPHPRFDVTAVDATVDYVPVAEFDPTLVEAQTPDWLIVLRTAEVSGFAGIIARDASQLDAPKSSSRSRERTWRSSRGEQRARTRSRSGARCWPTCLSSSSG